MSITEVGSQRAEVGGATPVLQLAARVMALREAGWTLSKIARKVGVSDTAMSLWLDGKYPADASDLEGKVSQFLERQDLERVGGVETIGTSVSAQLEACIKMAIRTNFIALVIGESGIGKSRSVAWYLRGNSSAIVLSLAGYGSDAGSVRSDLLRAARIRSPKKAEGGRRRAMIRQLEEVLRGSDRLIVVDNAHRLTRPAMQLLMDIHDRTGCPMVLLGTAEAEEKVLRDDQWSSRVRLRFELTPGGDDEWDVLTEHLVGQMLPGVRAEERRRLLKAAREVARGPGHFRRVESSLVVMRYLKESPRNRERAWVDLFEDAQRFLPGCAEQ